MRKINAIIIKLNDTEHERNERVQRKEDKMRQCWNWQTGTFEGRVSLTYGFKSRLPHHIGDTKWILTLKSPYLRAFFMLFSRKFLV